MSKHPDERIDQVLNALRDAEPPIGLEARIFSSIARATEARAEDPSRFAAVLNLVQKRRPMFVGLPLYVLAGATLALLLATFSIVRVNHPNLKTVARARVLPVTAIAHARAEQTSLTPTRPIPKARHSRPLPFTSPTPPSPTTSPSPDAIALAETLAPSRTASPLPLTPQEQLILSAMRPGQPIQVAELDIARAPALRAAAQAREDAAIQRYVRTALAPFAVADELQPTADSQPQETSTLSPAPQSPLSN